MIESHAMPPCMGQILRSLADGDNVTHPARFAFAAFALTGGVAPDDVAKAFIRTPNYSAEKTRTIIDGMVDRGYTPPNCRRMAETGLCSDSIKVGLCRSISNPISFLRARRGESEGRGIESKPSDAKSAPLQLVVAICQCGDRSRPVPVAIKEAVAAAHFWSIPAADSDNHIEVQYEVVSWAQA